MEVAVLADPHGVESIDTVLAIAEEHPERFVRAGPSLAFGYTRAVQWIRITLSGPPGEWWLDASPPYVEDLRLFDTSLGTDDPRHERVAGSALPYRAREVDARGFVFKLRLTDDKPHVYLLRMQTRSASLMNLRVVDPDVFHAVDRAEHGALLVVVGVLLVVLFETAWLYLVVRDATALWFMAWAATLLTSMLVVGGVLARDLLPDSPSMANTVVKINALLSFASGTEVYRRLLNVRRRQKTLHALYGIAFWVPLAAIPTVFTDHYVDVMPTVLATVSAISLIGLWPTLAIWRAERWRGLPLVLGMSATLLGTQALMATFAGMVGFPGLLQTALQALVFAGIVCFHVAIASRMLGLRAERRRALAAARSEQTLRLRQGRFIDVVTHEYRTPLAVLRTNLDLLRMDVAGDQRAEALTRMESAARRLNDLFGSALKSFTLGLVSEGRQTDFALRPLLEDLVTEARADHGLNGPEVALRVSRDARIRSDRKIAEVVFRNLLENAFKHAPAGSAVDVQAEVLGEQVAVAISNPASAPLEPHAQNLLERGTRGTDRPDVAGLGIGLHVARRLCEDLGGRIALDLSKAGRFRVEVLLPAAPPASSSSDDNHRQEEPES